MPRLRYIEENEKTPHARKLKQGEHAIDGDKVYADLGAPGRLGARVACCHSRHTVPLFECITSGTMARLP